MNLLNNSYTGKPTEEIDGLVCSHCSLKASLRWSLNLGCHVQLLPWNFTKCSLHGTFPNVFFSRKTDDVICRQIGFTNQGRAMLESGSSIFAARACHRFASILEANRTADSPSEHLDVEGLEALRPAAAPPIVSSTGWDVVGG